MSLETLPGELLLEVVSNIEFSAKDLNAMVQVNDKLRALIMGFELSLTNDIVKKQFPQALIEFPVHKSNVSLIGDEFNFYWLSNISVRYSIIDKLLGVIDKLAEDRPLRYEKRYNRNLFMAGYILMQHVADLGGLNILLITPCLVAC